MVEGLWSRVKSSGLEAQGLRSWSRRPGGALWGKDGDAASPGERNGDTRRASAGGVIAEVCEERAPLRSPGRAECGRGARVASRSACAGERARENRGALVYLAPLPCGGTARGSYVGAIEVRAINVPAIIVLSKLPPFGPLGSSSSQHRRTPDFFL